MELFIKPLKEGTFLPTKGTEGSAAFDLRAIEDQKVNSGTRALFDLGFAMQLPDGTYGQIAPRSSLSLKGIDIGAGVIDNDYRGSLGVVFINNGTEDFEVKAGMKIAQLLVLKVESPSIIPLKELSDTERSEGGFGSTGDS